MATVASVSLLHTQHIVLASEKAEIDVNEEPYEIEELYENDLSHCRLLSLPAEIRNHLYHLLLTSDLIPVLRNLIAKNQLSSYVLPPLPICPAILSTCRQIYQEASPIFYSLNTFTASPTLLTRLPFLITPFRPMSCPKSARKIKRWQLNVRLDVDPQFSESDATDAFTGVEELEIDASQAMFKSASMCVLLLFKKVRGIKRARVTGSVERDFAEWLENCLMAPIGAHCDDFDDGIDKYHIGNLSEKYNVWTHGNR